MYAGVRGSQLSTIDEIAGAYGISRSHLTKVVHFLGECDLLENIRGHGGGLRLKSRPEDIRLGELVRQTEQNLDLVECFQQPENASRGNCRIAGSCVLQGALHTALEAFFAVLDDWTLADLLAPKTALARDLGLRI